MIYDLSIIIKEEMPIYPGDNGFKRQKIMRLDNGDSSNLSAIHMGAHTGTHIDAPRHFLNDGISIEQLSLDALVGPARVIEVSAVSEIMLKDIISKLSNPPERILFKTDNSKLWQSSDFHKDFVYLSQEAADFLISEKIKLVGIDYLSIEKFHSPDHYIHKQLLGAGIIILEGINLSEVEEGDYELICLPLKIQGSDGSPVRAILRN